MDPAALLRACLLAPILLLLAAPGVAAGGSGPSRPSAEATAKPGGQVAQGRARLPGWRQGPGWRRGPGWRGPIRRWRPRRRHPDQLLAGAARRSIEPRPEPSRGEVWNTADCTRVAEDSSCIFSGGYGLGPVNPIESWDREYGLWARALALSDGDETLVLAVVDGTSWMARYERMCDGCGFVDLQRELASELGIRPSGFFLATTHSHTAPDFIGGWGGVPRWYMEQVTEALREAIREAVATLRPAVLEVGEQIAREHNRERRDTYRSAEDPTLPWLRALEVDRFGRVSRRVIATLGAYAAHPTTVDVGARRAHPDWPGLFEKRLEERFGGLGMHLMTGLGNMSTAGGTEMGRRLAELVPEVGQGAIVEQPRIRSAQAFFVQPANNALLITAIELLGLFDRSVLRGDFSLSAGRDPEHPCETRSEVGVETVVSAARVGSLVFTGAPGEIFSNYANTVKEKAAPGIAFPLGQVNDGLGYIPQDFEAVGIGPDTEEYEETFLVGHCFGDQALETTLELLEQLD